MIQTPAEFNDLIFASHKLLTEVKVSTTSDPSDYVLVEPTDGQVTLDNTSAIRGNASLTFNDPDLIPVDSSSLLAPYGNELIISRGLEIGGFSHMVQLGVFGIQDATVSEDGTLTIAASDRSQYVVDAIFEEVYDIAPGTDFSEAILDIVSYALATDYDFVEKDAVTPTLSGEQGEDRWAFVQDMAEILGCHLYFDNEAILTMKEIGLESAFEDISIVEGRDGVEVRPALLDLSRTWSRRDSHNKWIVISDNPDAEGAAPPQAEAIDDDPDSPTYYYGRFGRKPEVWHSTVIGELGGDSAAMCQAAADGKKAKEAGLTQEVNFGSLVNPSLEPNDVVHISRTIRHENEEIILVDEHHIIDSLTIPLSADGKMEAQTRRTFRSDAQ